MITAEYLRAQIAQMEAVIVANRGAIEFAQHLLGMLEQDGMPMAEFAEAIGGNGAHAEIQPAGADHDRSR